MKAFFSSTLAAIANNKLKIALIPAIALAWALILFPYGDLADFVSAKISAASGGALYVDMEALSLSVVPSIAATLEKVSIETPQFPAVSMASLELEPSLPSFLAFRPGGSVHAQGLFKGDVDATYSQGDKTQSGNRLQNVDIAFSHVALASVNELIRTQMPFDFGFKGSLTGKARASVDLAFDRQPSSSFDFGMSAFSINLTNFLGTDVVFAQAQLVGQMSDGKIHIERADLGDSKDELNAKIRGTMDLSLNSAGGGVRANPGSYDFTVALNASDAMVRKLSLFLDQITAQGGKADKTSTGMAYRFRAVPGVGGLPRYLPADQ